MFVPGTSNVSLDVNAPTALAVSWSLGYLVSVAAAMPVYVNGTLTWSYAPFNPLRPPGQEFPEGLSAVQIASRAPDPSAVQLVHFRAALRARRAV